MNINTDIAILRAPELERKLARSASLLKGSEYVRWHGLQELCRIHECDVGKFHNEIEKYRRGNGNTNNIPDSVYDNIFYPCFATETINKERYECIRALLAESLPHRLNAIIKLSVANIGETNPGLFYNRQNGKCESKSAIIDFHIAIISKSYTKKTVETAAIVDAVNLLPRLLLTLEPCEITGTLDDGAPSHQPAGPTLPNAGPSAKKIVKRGKAPVKSVILTNRYSLFFVN